MRHSRPPADSLPSSGCGRARADDQRPSSTHRVPPRGRGTAAHIPCCAIGGHPAARQQQAAGPASSALKVVDHDQHGDARGPRLIENAEQSELVADVEVGRRLVQEQDSEAPGPDRAARGEVLRYPSVQSKHISAIGFDAHRQPRNPHHALRWPNG